MSGSQGERVGGERLQARAEALIEVRRYHDALPLLAQATAADPDDYELHCLRGRVLMELGHLAEALQASEEAVRLAPDQAWPYSVRSCVLVKLDRVREALKAAREAARLAPHSAHTQFQLAVCEWMCWHRRAGRAAAERVRELAPEESSTYELLAWFDLGLFRFKSAEVHAREALRLAPQSWQAFNYLGQALRARRKGLEAIEALVEAAKLNPTESSIRYQLKLTVEGYLIRGMWPIAPAIVVYVRWMDRPNHPNLSAGTVALLAFAGVALAVGVLIGVHQWRLRTLPAEVVNFYKHAQWRTY